MRFLEPQRRPDSGRRATRNDPRSGFTGQEGSLRSVLRICSRDIFPSFPERVQSPAICHVWPAFAFRHEAGTCALRSHDAWLAPRTRECLSQSPLQHSMRPERACGSLNLVGRVALPVDVASDSRRPCPSAPTWAQPGRGSPARQGTSWERERHAHLESREGTADRQQRS